MPILKRLRDYLDRQNVPYQVLAHHEAYTAPEIAHTLHVSGKMLAKVVMVKADERFVMTVLPSNWQVWTSHASKKCWKHDTRIWRPKTSSRDCSRIARSGPCRRSGTSTA